MSSCPFLTIHFPKSLHKGCDIMRESEEVGGEYNGITMIFVLQRKHQQKCQVVMREWTNNKLLELCDDIQMSPHIYQSCLWSHELPCWRLRRLHWPKYRPPRHSMQIQWCPLGFPVAQGQHLWIQHPASSPNTFISTLYNSSIIKDLRRGVVGPEAVEIKIKTVKMHQFLTRCHMWLRCMCDVFDKTLVNISCCKYEKYPIWWKWS